jgi:hypothetical protein
MDSIIYTPTLEIADTAGTIRANNQEKKANLVEKEAVDEVLEQADREVQFEEPRKKKGGSTEQGMAAFIARGLQKLGIISDSAAEDDSYAVIDSQIDVLDDEEPEFGHIPRVPTPPNEHHAKPVINAYTTYKCPVCPTMV